MMRVSSAVVEAMVAVALVDWRQDDGVAVMRMVGQHHSVDMMWRD